MVGGVYGWFEYAGIYGVTFRNRFLSLSLFLWFCLLFEGKRGINNCGYRYSSIFIELVDRSKGLRNVLSTVNWY